MLEVNGSIVGLCEENAEFALLDGAVGGEGNLILFPFGRAYGDVFCRTYMGLAHRSRVDQLDADSGIAALGRTGPYAETVRCVLLEGYTEEAFVFKAGMLVVVAGGGEAHVMRVALERPVVLKSDVAVGVPSHKVLREFE